MKVIQRIKEKRLFKYHRESHFGEAFFKIYIMIAEKEWDYTYEKYRHLVFNEGAVGDYFSTTQLYRAISSLVMHLSYAIKYFDTSDIVGESFWGMNAYEFHACLDYMKELGHIIEITPIGAGSRVFTSAHFDLTARHKEKK